ncbi:hypothetical protein Syun_024854 [Stephania yunnanensis]|uniref:peptidyl-tRNA hydrolase n=1 Tax=Stephania yunnanensis TaxID=152371 RepID=A0AAP0EZD6_9MAGN
MSASADSSPMPSGDGGGVSGGLVQYVVLRRDLIDSWPLGSIVTQGCHAAVAAIWSYKDDCETVEYCSLENIDSMHKIIVDVGRLDDDVGDEAGDEERKKKDLEEETYSIEEKPISADPTSLPYSALPTTLFGSQGISIRSSLGEQVTLEVKGETQILNLSEKLTASSIAHKLWIEQPENIPTCLATKPYPKSAVSTFFRKLKLCK